MKTLCLFLAMTIVLCAAQDRAKIVEARSLGSLRNERDVPSLIAALGHKDVNFRFYAAFALGEIKSSAAEEALLRALRDPEWCVRDQAAWALREIGDSKLAEPLIAMLKEPGADIPHLLWLLQHYEAKEAVAPYLPRKPEVRTTSLAAHWSFDDKSTTVAKEGTGRAESGEIKGCTVAEGRVGAALRFGKGKFIELGKAPTPSVAQTPFTIMAWIKPETPTGVVVARGGAACGYSLYLKDGLPKFGIRRSQVGGPEIVAGKEKIGSDWTHLAGVVAGDHLELYVNGKLAATAPCKGNLPGNGGQGMEIGFDVGNSAVEITDAFEGLIDEVKQYNAALPETEIAKECQPK